MAFSFLQRGTLADHARDMSLARYVPWLSLEGLVTGIDNVRTDVFLSPKFSEVTRHQIAKLIAKYGEVEDFLEPEHTISFGAQRTSIRVRKMNAAEVPATPLKPNERADFKRVLLDLHVGALNCAKSEGYITLDLLPRLAIIKLQRVEMQSQFALITERCRAKLKTVDGLRVVNPTKAIDMRERFAGFQISKKAVLRKVGQELFATMREVEKESLGKLRRSLFGDTAASTYDLFLNRLLFTEDGRDDFLNAEQYVMMGNYDRDPDRFFTMREIACIFLRSLDMLEPDDDEEKAFDAILSAPENCQELFAGGSPEESTPKGKAQKALLAAWVELLEREQVMEHVIAAYELVPLLPQYSPPINPQQLKNALISKIERKRVETLLDEHGRISTDGLHAAVRRVDACKGTDRTKIAGRFFGDFLRYHRDLRRMEALVSAMDTVNVITTDKLRELSGINNTLYEYLLPEEQRPAEDKVIHHVILKADIRESTTLTRTLSERGLNPASYFSLNFYDPINKLLAKYAATKVFIEGDAVILALFEREGEQGLGVARTCVLAKEIIEIVEGYNEKSRQAGLPSLELGIGISYQDTAPMYLMDGSNRIMISRALNESDRLSSCTKGAKKFMASREGLFNVYTFQTVADADTGGIPEEFLVRYNIGGIHMSAEAFYKLQQEIALQGLQATPPSMWDLNVVRLYSGMVPVGSGVFHKIVVREGIVPFVNAADLSVKSWTDRFYYEVCTHPAIYRKIEQQPDVAAVSS